MKSQVCISDLMTSSGVAFGTSGARGLVEAMTDRICFAYTCGFLQHLEDIGHFSKGAAVSIAGDLRPSTPRILQACAAAILHKGGKIDYCGFVPSPSVAAHGFAHNSGSLMVTGSHIPDDRNGIKFNRADGEILKADEIAIRAQNVEIPDIFDAQGMLNEPIVLPALTDVSSSYLARYVDFFGAKALEGMALGVYEHSAVGRDIFVQLVKELGGTVHRLGRSDCFIPVDTEAVRPEDHALAQQWSRELNLDAILSSDGDSDRPLLADENGNWIRGDILGILCARALGASAIATPVSCNSAVESAQLFDAIHRTRIGSPFVIEAMQALIHDGHAVVCGYEANGGFLLGSAVTTDTTILAPLPTRDAALPMIATLVDAQRKNLPLSALQAELPARFTFSERLQNYPVAQSAALIEKLIQGEDIEILDRLTALFKEIAGVAKRFDLTDGLRIYFDNADIIHLRPSGNAPELRCYTECDTMERASSINDQVLHLIERNAFAV
ncbi:phosphomannomutase [Sphingobium yanoikuyae]|uniref:phosphomannomutase n=1 Tax=Sphingobium yanoikuyae TaxID=13690 RepID=UPI0035B26179